MPTLEQRTFTVRRPNMGCCSASGADLANENPQDDELLEFVRTAEVGEILRCGGGAAPIVEVERQS